MNLDSFKKIHLIGIGGIGISAVAKLLLSLGKFVTGSDLYDSETIKALSELGAQIKIGEHKKENVARDINLVIYTDAVPEDNPERVKTKRLGIKSLSYFQFLGEFSRGKYTIAISSTHGKTTTTAMAGLILENAGFDPTVVVGSKVKKWQGNLRIGNSKYFVVEADDYRGHMLEFEPKVVIVNNIEFEHPDFFKDINHSVEIFQQFINKVPKDGYFIYNSDEQILNKKIKKPDCRVLNYGIRNKKADLTAKNIKISQGCQTFKPIYKGRELKDFVLRIPGEFNISNALAASLLALELGISENIIRNTLSQYTGAWRRFEILGKLKGALIITDYAHHPTEVAKTIKAVKEFYPNNRLFVAFQPHQKKRTKELLDQFVQTFVDTPAELIILSEIYDVAGREEKFNQISSENLKEKIISFKKKSTNKKSKNETNYYYAKDLKDTKNKILEKVKPNDVVLILGAGDIDKMARELI